MSKHLCRMLSLDTDGADFTRVTTVDPVIGGIVDPKHGIRPPLFWTPYEAAIWAVLSQRVRMTQAVNLKARLAAALSTQTGDEQSLAAPPPSQLAQLSAFDGLPDVKVQRLRAVASAALDGLLDADGLRSRSTEDALAELQAIDGIGPFSAELILVRGAGAPDVFPMHEQRLHRHMRHLYSMPEATPAELREVAKAWAPYRSWVAFQLRAHAERVA